MLKLITTDPSYFQDEPNFTVLSDNLDGLVKKAADSAVLEFASNLRPDERKIYVHIIALGAGEYFSSNRNGDFFPEQNLIEHLKTFETSPAHVFTNHINRNPDIAIGQVVFATYNHRMHRVELVAWIDRVRGKDYVERIERGEFPSTSMACKTPWDTCSICHNKARTRQEYCYHLSTELGRLYPDGRKAMAINDGPLKFFDISMVVRPADVTSSVLQKVAYVAPGECLTGSAEMAEIEGLVEKSAAHKKLSEFIKELDGEVVGFDESLAPILARIKDPVRDSIPALSLFELGEVLDTFAHLGISPSLGFLADMMGHRISGEEGLGVVTRVEGYLKEHGLAKLPVDDMEYGQSGPNRRIVDVLLPSIKQASIYPQYIAQRAADPAVVHGGTVYVPGTGYGYTGNGPHVEPTPQEVYRSLLEREGAQQEPAGSGLLGMIKTLITIGGAALAAKWYITKMIQKRMDEVAESKQQNDHSGIKIVLVKSASDANISSEIARMSLLQSVGVTKI